MDKADWNLVRAFCATADAGSLSAAARRLGLTQPTLSRQVAALEARLGVTLFERVGKKLVATEVGLGLLEHARTMASAADAMALAAAGSVQDVEGRVTISATDTIAAYLLPDVVARLRREAPQITLAIVASNSFSDLRRREADIAIRHARPTEPDLIVQLVRETTAHFYASAGWVGEHGMPGSVAPISAANLVAFEPVERFAGHLAGIGLDLRPDGFRIVSENAVVLWELARHGLGVCMMLRDIAERTPGMVRLLPDLPGVPVPIWLVSHRELRTSRRVRVVFEAIAEELRGDRTGASPGPQRASR